MQQNIENYTIIILLVAMLALGSVAVIEAARSHAASKPCEAADTGWEPPNLQLCPEDMTLWNCIRNASYRTDI